MSGAIDYSIQLSTIDNAIQLVVIAGCGIYAAMRFLRRREQAWFLLTCFYGAFALGLIYWILFLVFRSDVPRVSPVSDLSWMASVLFLLVLQTTLRLPGECTCRPPSAWAVPAFCAVMGLYFFQWGDYFLNILWEALLGACGYFALRGLLFARRQRGRLCGRQYFHMAVLAFVLLEHGLWVASCHWQGGTLANPYYWFDFLLSATFFTFLPMLKKAVSE